MTKRFACVFPARSGKRAAVFSSLEEALSTAEALSYVYGEVKVYEQGSLRRVAVFSTAVAA
jgi:hypothetical protein